MAVRRWFSRLDPEAVDQRTQGARGCRRWPRVCRGRRRSSFTRATPSTPAASCATAPRPSCSACAASATRWRPACASEAERHLRSEAYAPYLQDEYVTLREDRFVLPLQGLLQVDGPRHRARHLALGRDGVRRAHRHGRAEQPPQGGRDRDPPREPAHPRGAGRPHRRGGPRAARRPGDPHPARRHLRRRPPGAGLRRGRGGHRARARSSICAPCATRCWPCAPRRARRWWPTTSRWARSRARATAKVLVVSGPNAGGKTVLLKAVGLAALAARAGLLVPAAPGSRVGFFDRVLADIGDQQSVLGDLSTFSAHLANLARILEAVRAAEQAQPAGPVRRADGRHPPRAGRRAGPRHAGGAGRRPRRWSSPPPTTTASRR